MKKRFIVLVVTLAVFAAAGVYAAVYSSYNFVPGSATKGSSPVVDLGTARGPMEIALVAYSSTAQVRVRTGGNTGYQTITTVVSTARTTHRITRWKPARYVYVRYTSCGKVSHSMGVDVFSW